jgi:hypothetical protein
MFKMQYLAENRWKSGTSHHPQSAGFVAIFNGARYSSDTNPNVSFYTQSCHLIPQHRAVYIALGTTNAPSFAIHQLYLLRLEVTTGALAV